MKLIKKEERGYYMLGTKKDSLLMTVYKNREEPNFDPEYWVRLIEKAPEMEQKLETFVHILNCNSLHTFGRNHLYLNCKEILDYLKPKEEEMVTLKMSRKSAESANFLKFEVK